MTSPTSISPSAALTLIRRAARTNTATSTNLGPAVYAAAGVTALPSNLSAYNSALDSAAVNGRAVNTAAEVQNLVNAYDHLLTLADGAMPASMPVPNAMLYNTIGVKGISDAAKDSNALHLLNDALVGISRAKVDTVAEVQALADAAQHVMAAAGGNNRQAAALSLNDFHVLGITGVTAANLATVQQAIRQVGTDSQVDTRAEIQGVVKASLSANALAVIADAAEHNTATANTVGLDIYTAAGVTGVNHLNLASINSALNSQAVMGAQADTTAEVQAIVDTYNAILTLTSGYGGVPVPTPTAAQFASIGVTGLSGTISMGPVHLLNDALFGITPERADTVQEVQAIADAARHVMDAAGGTAEQAALLTLADFANLGITGVNADTLAVAQNMVRVSTDADVNYRFGVQDLISAKIGHERAGALGSIFISAENNTAFDEKLGTDIYAAAGVSGVDSSNVSSINSALNSAPITAFDVLSTGAVQTIVNAYNAILDSADGVAGNTPTALTGAQYKAIGVTGVNGLAAEGSALHLLDDVVDSSARSAVDTLPELQAMADAAAHVIAAVGGTPAQAAAVSAADLKALGMVGVESTYLAGVQAALQALTTGAAVDTRTELQALVSMHHISYTMLSATQLTVSDLVVDPWGTMAQYSPVLMA